MGPDAQVNLQDHSNHGMVQCEHVNYYVLNGNFFNSNLPLNSLKRRGFGYFYVMIITFFYRLIQPVDSTDFESQFNRKLAF